MLLHRAYRNDAYYSFTGLTYVKHLLLDPISRTVDLVTTAFGGPVAAMKGVTFVAVGSAVDPVNVINSSIIATANPEVVLGALLGGLAFVLVGKGSRWDRVRRGIGGGLVSYMFTEGLVEFFGYYFAAFKPTPSGYRLAAGVMAIMGVAIAEALLRGSERFRDKSEDLVDAGLNRFKEKL